MDSVTDIPEVLCKIVELKTGIKKADMLVFNRKRKYVMARCIYTNLLAVYTNLTELEIAKKIKKDRSSVYYMYRIHEDLISVDKPYLDLFQSCAEQYVNMVCNNKHLKVDIGVIMERINKLEAELKELKELVVIKSYTKDDELVAS